MYVADGFGPPPTLDMVELFGVRVARCDRYDALWEVERLYEAAEPAWVAFVNAHTLNLAVEDPGYLAVLRRADLVLNDGLGVSLAARLRAEPFRGNLNGTDFTPILLRRAARLGWKVFLLGSRPGVAARAATVLRRRIPGLVVAGTHHGWLDQRSGAELAGVVRASGADVVLVGLGNPRQEKWLDEHLRSTGARLGVAVGAYFDFTAGVVSRAPGWVNRMGMEWVYRLANEPQRLARRYMVGNPVFLARLLAEQGRPRSGSVDRRVQLLLGRPWVSGQGDPSPLSVSQYSRNS